MLSKLIYASQAVRPCSESDLESLLVAARRHNASHGLSGLLLYANQSFLQILEGELDELTVLYERIATDARHTRLRLLVSAPISTRKFACWSMGFEQIDERQMSASLPGFMPACEYPLVNPALIRDGVVAETLLDLYQRNAQQPA